MHSSLFEGITGSLIASIIFLMITWFFTWLVRYRLAIQHIWKIRLLSITVSTIIFIFGILLKWAVQTVFEPEKLIFEVIVLARKNDPLLFLVCLSLQGLFPGIITGLSSSAGQSLGYRIGYAMLAAIFSLSIWDTISFFFMRAWLPELENTDSKVFIEIGHYYFFY
jgi:hypothetical protein